MKIQSFLQIIQSKKTARKSYSTKAYIYGAGNLGKQLSIELQDHGITVLGFFDVMARSKPYWNGYPVFHPDKDIQFLKNQFSNIDLYIAVLNRDADTRKIIEKMATHSFKSIFSPVDWIDDLPDTYPTYWLTPKNYYDGILDSCLSAVDLWADQTSKDMYLAMLAHRLTGDFSLLPEPSKDDQYIPTDLVSRTHPLRLVDCGAYTGDTINNFLNYGFLIQAVAAFEPDLLNYGVLLKTLKSLKIPEKITFPCGLHSQAIQLSFSSLGSEGSSVTTKGMVTIQCVRLDDVISTFVPNYLKMDIEGAEFDALLGSKNIINESMPLLAISVYHRPEHLWSIPTLISNWNLGYKLYLRSHGYNQWETVLYGIPSK